MEIIPGGYRDVIIADNPIFNNYIRVKDLLKRGTAITPTTLVEEGGNNEMLSAGKKVTVNTTSVDHDTTVFDALKNAEESRTVLYFRFYSIHPHYYVDIMTTEIVVKREYNEAGKFNTVSIEGTSSGVTEDDILTLVYMFNLYNPDNL